MQYKLTVEELCTKLKPVFGKKMDELYLKYAMAESREEKEEIEHILNALYHKNLSELLNKKVLLEPPSKTNMDGEYPLAVVSYADKKLFSFNLREQDWIRHVCISGMSGSGKTTLAFHITKNFIEKNKPFLIFDWKKSFRPLMLVDPEIMCFTVGNEAISNLFKINVNQPPEGVAPKEWINVLCDLITESFFASYGVHKILLETLDEAFKDFGVYSGSKNYPTWNEIKWRLEEKLEKKKGREASWLMSALRITHILTFGNFGKVLNYKGKESLKVEDLLNKKILFELNTLGNIEKKFFCEFLLTYIYKLKKAKQTAISQSFDHAILVDEAHNIFLKEKTHFVKESVTDMVYREMREYGTCLICLDQHISKISDTVVGNSACHIAFQQQLPQDIETISGLMQLRDRKQFFSMLPVGSAIVKLSERYTLPFLIEVSQVDLRNKEIFDRDIADKMKFIFQGREIEQGKDPEFAKALMQPSPLELQAKEPELQEEPEVKEIEPEEKEEAEAEDIEAEKTELKQKEEVGEPIQESNLVENIVEDTKNLNDVQQVLCEFVEKKLDRGVSIREVERVLEENAIEGGYSIIDVSEVINYVLGNQFKNKPKLMHNLIKNIASQGTPKIYKEENSLFEREITEITDEQERFLAFLQSNLDHDYSTIELYKKLGLSARKGNKLKNKLLDENLIKIQEKKNTKGWKKIIRLA